MYFYDQSELSSRTYNCLKRSNNVCIWDLLSHSQEDLMKMEDFRIEDVKQILGTLQKHFAINLPKKKKRPKVRDFSIGKVAPIPNQRATAVPIKKTVVATGRRNGFWNLLTFSKKGTESYGTETMKRTPKNLLGTVAKSLKYGKKVPFGHACDNFDCPIAKLVPRSSVVRKGKAGRGWAQQVKIRKMLSALPFKQAWERVGLCMISISRCGSSPTSRKGDSFLFRRRENNSFGRDYGLENSSSLVGLQPYLLLSPSDLTWDLIQKEKPKEVSYKENGKENSDRLRASTESEQPAKTQTTGLCLSDI
ncbi:hypothetical protein IEQ34_024155 [Dendrobium chrysotoxum]|uniref:RNA polymerase alpha subunit C-terminal domain-containing protein n=1 Tax=Dendrobium chrysotoxum TaxID=161865 RepID=A0AAV7FSS7_DENCH|nr:hypothetical protein IEQ34_024155 [Dendrobium chrysotoxum]